MQINQNLVVQANLSYGGVKSSGLGKEGEPRIDARALHAQENYHGELRVMKRRQADRNRAAIPLRLNSRGNQSLENVRSD